MRDFSSWTVLQSNYQCHEEAVCWVYLGNPKEARGAGTGNMGENEFIPRSKEPGHIQSFRKRQGFVLVVCKKESL